MNREREREEERRPEEGYRFVEECRIKRKDVEYSGHPVYTLTILEEARRTRGMPRSFLLVRHVCYKGAVPGCIIMVCARHIARFSHDSGKMHVDCTYEESLQISLFNSIKSAILGKTIPMSITLFHRTCMCTYLST